jgi:hypothetical protein
MQEMLAIFGRIIDCISSQKNEKDCRSDTSKVNIFKTKNHQPNCLYQNFDQILYSPLPKHIYRKSSIHVSVGQAEGLACADAGVRTRIDMTGIFLLKLE